MFSLASPIKRAFSGTNFALNVLLARWLSGEEYGAFSVTWAIGLIFAALHNALIIEPMMVVGPAEFGSRIASYLKRVMRLNLATVFIMGILAASASFFYRGLAVRDALSALGLALPGYLLLMTARREQYITDRPIRAFYLSIGYAALLASGLVVLHSSGMLAAWSAVLVTGLSLLVALWALFQRNLPLDFQPSPQNLGEISIAHWHYGKWLFASALLGIGISDLQVLLLSKMVDLHSAGALRALINFILPVGQLFTVLSVYSLPKLVRSRKSAASHSVCAAPVCMQAVSLPSRLHTALFWWPWARRWNIFSTAAVWQPMYATFRGWHLRVYFQE